MELMLSSRGKSRAPMILVVTRPRLCSHSGTMSVSQSILLVHSNKEKPGMTSIQEKIVKFNILYLIVVESNVSVTFV